jgi:hypothetical protein
MPDTLDERKQISDAAARLGRSERGQQAMRDLRTLLCNGASELDGANKVALMHLLLGAWGSNRGLAYDELRRVVLAEGVLTE